MHNGHDVATHRGPRSNYLAAQPSPAPRPKRCPRTVNSASLGKHSTPGCSTMTPPACPCTFPNTCTRKRCSPGKPHSGTAWGRNGTKRAQPWPPIAGAPGKHLPCRSRWLQQPWTAQHGIRSTRGSSPRTPPACPRRNPSTCTQKRGFHGKPRSGMAWAHTCTRRAPHGPRGPGYP